MCTQPPVFAREMEKKGFEVVPAKRIGIFHQPEQLHADMQALRIGNRLFTLDSCEKPAGRDYPENVRLNCLYLGGRLYGKLSAVDSVVLDFCRKNGIETVNVNQGYARCSTLAVNDNAVITADKTIADAAERYGADTLRISEGHIRLQGFDYGFIGGASAVIEKTVYFFGNVKKHPDYEKIRAFIGNHNSEIEILCEELPLTDIGGAVILTSCGPLKVDSAPLRFSSARS